MNRKTYSEDDIAHLATLLAQEIAGELRTQFEIFDDVRNTAKRLPSVEERVTATEADVKTLQALARATHRDIKTLQGATHAH